MEDQVLYDGFVKVSKDKKTGYETVSVTDSVAFLLYERTTDRVILTIQHRDPIGCAIIEVPAGRFDVDLDVKELVVKEAKEEVGVSLSEDDVILLNNGKPLAVSPGVLTEKCYLAYAEITMSQITFDDKKFYGVPEEGEKITRIIIPASDLYGNEEFQDLKTYALVQHFLKERLGNIE